MIFLFVLYICTYGFQIHFILFLSEFIFLFKTESIPSIFDATASSPVNTTSSLNQEVNLINFYLFTCLYCPLSNGACILFIQCLIVLVAIQFTFTFYNFIQSDISVVVHHFLFAMSKVTIYQCTLYGSSDSSLISLIWLCVTKDILDTRLLISWLSSLVS